MCFMSYCSQHTTPQHTTTQHNITPQHHNITPPQPPPHTQVHMYINSPGGVVTAGLAIYDTMQYIKSPISTLCIGQAASMASLLLAAGSPGERRCLPHSRIMVHQPIGGAQVRGLRGLGFDVLSEAPSSFREPESVQACRSSHRPHPPPTSQSTNARAPRTTAATGPSQRHFDPGQGDRAAEGCADRAVRAAHAQDVRRNQ